MLYINKCFNTPKYITFINVYVSKVKIYEAPNYKTIKIYEAKSDIIEGRNT